MWTESVHIWTLSGPGTVPAPTGMPTPEIGPAPGTGARRRTSVPVRAAPG